MVIVMVIVFVLFAFIGAYLLLDKPQGENTEIRLKVVCISLKNNSTNLDILILHNNGSIEYSNTTQVSFGTHTLYEKIKESSSEMYTVNVTVDNTWSGEVSICPSIYNHVNIVLNEEGEPKIFWESS